MKKNIFVSICSNVVIVSILVILLSTSLLGHNDSVSTVATNNRLFYKGNSTDSVALMFNVYEGSKEVEEIANILKARGVNATFFVGGIWASKNTALVVDLDEQGMEIGNHGYLHKDHSRLDMARNLEEINLTNMLIKELTGRDNTLFAPPSGAIGSNMHKAVAKLDMVTIMWSIDTIDWRDHNVGIITSRATKNLQAGDFVLMHPTPQTVEALPKILDYMDVAGLKCSTVGHLVSNNV